MVRMSRRRFLAALGALGGGGAVVGALRTLDLSGDDGTRPFTPPSVGDFSLRGRAPGATVVVLGAGVAGLCCAYELEKADYRVTVVEARDRVGGRSWTVRGGTQVADTRGAAQRAAFADGLWFNPGPARIAQHHTTLDYCRELRVPVEVLVNSNADAYVDVAGVTRRRRAVRADLDAYVAEMLAKTGVPTTFLDEPLTGDERAAVLEHLRAMGALGSPLRGYAEPPGAGDAPGEVAAPYDLASLLGVAPHLGAERDWDQAMPMFQPVGGMDAVPRALAGALRGDVLTGVRVSAVGHTGDGVRVVAHDATGEEVVVAAEHGICTLPPHLAAGLAADWDPGVTTALRRPAPVTTGKIGLEFGRRFWETDDRIFGGVTATDRSVREIWYPSTGYLGERGIVVGAYPFGPAADRFGAHDHAGREAMAVAAGVAIHGPAYRDELRSSFSVDWASQPWSEGAWAAWPQYGPDFDRLLEPAGRWWFAGDWLSRATGWQHGAFESARLTVTRLHAAVLAGP